MASDEGFGWGKLLEAMRSLSVEVDEMLKVQIISDVFLFVEGVLPKYLALRFCGILCLTVPTPRVGLSLNR